MCFSRKIGTRPPRNTSSSSLGIQNKSRTLAGTLGRLSVAGGGAGPGLFADGRVDAAGAVFSAGRVFGICCAGSCQKRHIPRILMGWRFVRADLSVGCPCVFHSRLFWIAESRCADIWARQAAVGRRSLLRAAGAVRFVGPNHCDEPAGYFAGVVGVGMTLAI